MMAHPNDPLPADSLAKNQAVGDVSDPAGFTVQLVGGANKWVSDVEQVEDTNAHFKVSEAADIVAGNTRIYNGQLWIARTQPEKDAATGGTDPLNFANYPGAGAAIGDADTGDWVSHEPHVIAGQENVNLLENGFLLDGSDESEKFRDFAAEHPRKGLIVPDGKLLGWDKQIIMPHLSLVGGGEVKFGVSQAIEVTETGSILGVTLSGDGLYTLPIELKNDEGYFVMDDGASVVNLYSEAFGIGVLINGANRAYFGDVSFENITALSNGVTADSEGSVSGIQFTGSVAYGEVSSRARFTNINTVDAGGIVVYEDADGIKVTTKTATQASPEFINASGTYINCGKRAVKFNSTTGEGIYKATDMTVESPWDRTGTETVDGVAMNSVCNCFSGHLVVEDIRTKGGAFRTLVNVAEGCISARIQGVHKNHQSVRTAFGEDTSTISAVVTSPITKIDISDVEGPSVSRRGIRVANADRLCVSRSEINYETYGVFCDSVKRVTVEKNDFNEANVFGNSRSILFTNTMPDEVDISKNTEHVTPRYLVEFGSPVSATARVTIEKNDALSASLGLIEPTNEPVDDGVAVNISGNRT